MERKAKRTNEKERGREGNEEGKLREGKESEGMRIEEREGRGKRK